MRDRCLMKAAVCWIVLLGWICVPAPVGAADDAAEVDSGAAMADDGPGGHGGGAPPSPVSVDPDLAIVTAIVFLTLLFVLWKFAWGPIIASIDAREKAMADNLAEAARSNEEAKRLLDEHESKLAAAASDVRQMLDEAKKEADYQKQQILDQAQAAAESEKDRALREIDSAKNEALQDLAQSSVNTAVELAGKIVKRQLSPADHSQLISESLEKFPSKN